MHPPGDGDDPEPNADPGPEPAPILPYATPPPRRQPINRILGWPLIFGVLQFPWLLGMFMAELAVWGPKNIWKDSARTLVIAAPSIVAAVVAVRTIRFNSRHDRDRDIKLICLFIFAVSAFIVGWLFLWWMKEILLDPHGTWYAL